MSLIDEISVHNAPAPRGCAIATARESLSESDQKDLDAALENAEYTHRAIARALANRGFKIHPAGKQVARHRRRECECHR